MITYYTQAQLDSKCREDELTAMTSTDLADRESARVQEIQDHPVVRDVNVLGRDHEGYLVVTINADDSDRVYTYLFIARDGRVAEAMLNQPRYFASFADLATASFTRSS